MSQLSGYNYYLPQSEVPWNLPAALSPPCDPTTVSPCLQGARAAQHGLLLSALQLAILDCNLVTDLCRMLHPYKNLETDLMFPEKTRIMLLALGTGDTLDPLLG